MTSLDGKRIRELRNAVDLSQEALGELAGLERHDITRIEKGYRATHTYDVVERLAKGFGLEIEDMAAYLRGEITVRAALLRIRSAEKRAAS